MGAPPPTWRLARGRGLLLDRPRLVGVVNATPDSFSDGGAHGSAEALAEHALRLVDDGADVIDVGGESTRPGAARVGAEEQIARTVPVIEKILAARDVLVSIDTTRADVARRALDAGAVIINDVSAGGEDEAMLPLAAERAAGVVLMHRLVAPGDDRYSDRYETPPLYDDVVADVTAFLVGRARAAEAAGVGRASIVIDPGLGFGKTVEQNYALIARAGEIVASGYPVLGAASRKSFIGVVTGRAEPGARVLGSIAVSVAHALAGVQLFRVHDVAAHAEALAVTRAVIEASKCSRTGPVGPARPAV